MKLRVTGLLLGILILVAVIVPAFAAVAEESEETEAVESEVSEVTDEVEEAETESEVEVIEEIIETPVSTSPFYLEGVQLTDLVYQNIGGTNYVTVESFLTAMDPEAMVEEVDGAVTASSVTVTEVVDVETEDAGMETANVVDETLTFSAVSGNCYVVANGRCLYVESGVQSIEGKVAVPVRTLAKVFNLDVGYDHTTRHVLLTRQEGEGAYILAGESYYDADILYWLSHIIYAESGNQSMSGKIAVGNVVMNRLASPMFPNTIKGVLFQKNQFSPAMSGSIYRDPNAGSVVAAKLVMDGAVVLENALFFNRAGMNTFASRNRTYVATIGAHAFYD